MSSIRIVTFGTFDVFHVGHLRILEAAKELGTYLVVGVSTDLFTQHKKGKFPVYHESERCEIILGLKCVNEVFLEESFELKRHYLLANQADILVMGSDWHGQFDEFSDICQVRYLPRTPSISTTAIIEKIRDSP